MEKDTETGPDFSESGYTPDKAALITVQLYAKYRKEIMKILHKHEIYFPNDEEVLQEIFLAFLDRLRKGRILKEIPDYYLLGIVRKKYLEYLRNIGRRRKTLIYRPDPYLEGGPVADVSAETIEVLKEALSELPEKQRRLFELRDLEGYSPEEAAEMTGYSRSSAGKILTRIRERLRRSLAGTSSSKMEKVRL